MKRKLVGKSKISKVQEARMVANFELECFIVFIRGVDPRLKPEEAIVLSGFVLHELPNLFKENPLLLIELKDTAKRIRDRGE